MEARSIIRWQHRLKREHPTCTERTKSLNEECGWKGGDSGDWAGEKTLSNKKNEQIHLTPTGLLMEGDYAQMYGPPPDCKRFEDGRRDSLRKCIRPLSGEFSPGT